MPFTDIDRDALFKHLPAPCIALDHSLCIIGASDLYLSTVSRKMGDIRGQYIFDAFPETDDRRKLIGDALRRALAGEKNTLVEVPYAIPVVDETGKDTGEMREIWWTCVHHPVYDADGQVEYMIQNALDVTQQVMAIRLKDAVTQELQHRVGNIFSLVSATAKRTVANAEDLPDFLQKFEGRLMALARTHRYLTGENWDGISLDQIVRRELAQYEDIEADRIKLSGDRIIINATEAQILTLAIHELTTNSIKHGALKSNLGQLDIAWHVTGRMGYDFRWSEIDINIDPQPARAGFGSFILENVVPSQLQATAHRIFQTDRFDYTLTVPDRMQHP
ncbi:HWE histidine kinase domain-containing protein [Loktanella sp. SALINAS62]|uniref:HWE histidine kinase domain-containing protein n=1 Tax=Loktanella sp. SALINAS62 TaxID=2706124 RepID=UPI001B8CC987|nr:HWE histidine kinase domain-containing protein [Loktanella sp. SALINAS62]MBS1301856.1 PAS domain-containing protein [Loktanella sp. SALINAS62]